jgi:hypothetical protein
MTSNTIVLSNALFDLRSAHDALTAELAALAQELDEVRAAFPTLLISGARNAASNARERALAIGNAANSLRDELPRLDASWRTILEGRDRTIAAHVDSISEARRARLDAERDSAGEKLRELYANALGEDMPGNFDEQAAWTRIAELISEDAQDGDDELWRPMRTYSVRVTVQCTIYGKVEARSRDEAEVEVEGYKEHASLHVSGAGCAEVDDVDVMDIDIEEDD